MKIKKNKKDIKYISVASAVKDDGILSGSRMINFAFFKVLSLIF